MNISRDEALEALEAIREVEQRTRRSINLAGGGPIMMIWGVVWLIGFLGGAALGSEQQGALWGIVDSLGLVATLVVVGRLARRVRDPVGPRLGLLWLFLIGYGALWIWIAHPLTDQEIGVMAATIAMFGYVVLGLWLDRLFMWIGLAVTALTLAGYLLVPEWFDIWMGILGGGALLSSGAYIQLRWR